MKIITRKELANTAAARWFDQYAPSLGWSLPNAVLIKTKEQIYNELVGLGDNPLPDDVDGVIGNKAWTACSCDECGKKVEWVVRVGEEPDYESSTAHICSDCIKNLTKLVKEMKK